MMKGTLLSGSSSHTYIMAIKEKRRGKEIKKKERDRKVLEVSFALKTCAFCVYNYKPQKR